MPEDNERVFQVKRDTEDFMSQKKTINFVGNGISRNFKQISIHFKERDANDMDLESTEKKNAPSETVAILGKNGYSQLFKTKYPEFE